ncbi:MAG: PspC domain-containing protein [Bacteroidales bacterium]|nr:PspC domain-containing protein [Bacteroidales bacterium]
MKKTISINISGMMFNIDEDAYQRLSDYLDSIRNHFSRSEGHEDIIADIESRIAELLQKKISELKQVINLADVKEVISILGQPFEMDDEQDKGGSTEDQSQAYRRKRLFRDPDNKKLGGVAAGLAAYFGTDALWIRLAIVILVLSTGIGLFVYLALWVFVPEAISTADKLEMRGEPVNVANIEQSIKQEYESVKTRLNEYAGDARETLHKTTRQAGYAASRLNDPILRTVQIIARLFGIIFGSLFLGIGLLLFLVIGSLFWGWDDISMFSDAELPVLGGEYLWQLLLSGPLSISIAPVALGAFIIIPVVMLVYAGLRLLIGEYFRVQGLGSVAAGLWIASLIGIVYIGLSMGLDMKEKYQVDEKVITESTALPSHLVVTTDGNSNRQGIRELAFFEQRFSLSLPNDSSVVVGKPAFYIDRTREAQAWLEITRMARGKTTDKARERAENILYPLQFSDSSLVLPLTYGFPSEDKLRDQKIIIRLYLPEGEIITLDNTIKPLLTWSLMNSLRQRDDQGKKWIMTSDGLKPFVDDSPKLP